MLTPEIGALFIVSVLLSVTCTCALRAEVHATVRFQWVTALCMCAHPFAFMEVAVTMLCFLARSLNECAAKSLRAY